MNICFYGASSPDLDQRYTSACTELGRFIARRGHGVVFGGGTSGLMGAVAKGVKAESGTLIGISPRFFDKDGILDKECTEFIFTETMRERKQAMEEHSDAFIVAPGGIGTFEEFLEMLTLAQLGRHRKGIAIYNINGYYDGLIEFFKTCTKERFIKESVFNLFGAFDDPEALLDHLENYDGSRFVVDKY